MEILDKLNIDTVFINDVLCIRLIDFATVTNRSHGHISNLTLKGNSVRKLKCIRIGNNPYIPVSEITEYPFTTVGRNCQTYYYKEDGTTTDVEEKE